jgi:hypothetical protein
MTWNDNLSNLLDVNFWCDIIADDYFTAENAETTEMTEKKEIRISGNQGAGHQAIRVSDKNLYAGGIFIWYPVIPIPTTR